MVYFMQKKSDKMFKVYNKALKLNKNLIGVHCDIGIYHTESPLVVELGFSVIFKINNLI